MHFFISRFLAPCSTVTHIARVKINRVRLPILLKTNIFLSSFAPKNLVSRDGFGSPVARQPAHLHAQAESAAYLRDSSRVPRLSNPSRGNKFSGANGDRENIIFPVQLTTSRIGNLTRLIFILAICVVIRHRVSPEFIGSRNCVPMAFTAESPPAQGQ